jgi:hypothetical protein
MEARICADRHGSGVSSDNTDGKGRGAAAERLRLSLELTLRTDSNGADP